MERETFTSLFKDLISRLYDRVAIETHPLATYFPVAEDASNRRAEVIQQLRSEPRQPASAGSRLRAIGATSGQCQS